MYMVLLQPQLHRSRIGRAPNFRSSVESSTMLHSNAQDKCRRISVCLSKLDNRLVATNLNHMLWADMVGGAYPKGVAHGTDCGWLHRFLHLGLERHAVDRHLFCAADGDPTAAGRVCALCVVLLL